eukprot:5793833-Prymnesium_polylepis.1
MQPAPPPPHPMADQSSRPLGRRKSVQVAPVPRRGLRPRVALALDCLRDRLHERHEAAGVAERRLARDVSTAEERAGQPVLRDLFARVAGEDIDEGQVWPRVGRGPHGTRRRQERGAEPRAEERGRNRVGNRGASGWATVAQMGGRQEQVANRGVTEAPTGGRQGGGQRTEHVGARGAAEGDEPGGALGRG